MAHRLLIVGDSFSASKNEPNSWVNLLKNYHITNLSQAGCSEYRILLQLKSVDLNNFDQVVIVHTSPNRIYIDHNPIHQSSKTHDNCDLIYQDVLAQPSSQFRDHVIWWFENVFDLNYASTMHTLLIDELVRLTHKISSLHISFFETEHESVYNLHNTWKKYSGTINHLSIQGNQKVAEFISKKLKEVQ